MIKKISAKKINPQKCSYHNCKKVAVGSVSVDIDSAALRFCATHRETIKSSMLWLILGVTELYLVAKGFPKTETKKLNNDKKINDIFVTKKVNSEEQSSRSKKAPKSRRG